MANYLEAAWVIGKNEFYKASLVVKNVKTFFFSSSEKETDETSLLNWEFWLSLDQLGVVSSWSKKQ